MMRSLVGTTKLDLIGAVDNLRQMHLLHSYNRLTNILPYTFHFKAIERESLDNAKDNCVRDD